MRQSDGEFSLADLTGDEGGDRRNSGTKRQNAEVLRDMVGLATDLVAIVKSVQGLEVACRAGISQGEVCAGMLGLLQPRFQLIGEAMHRAAECEQKATIGTVHASQDVLTEIQAFEGGQMASGGEQTASGMVRERFGSQKMSVGVGWGGVSMRAVSGEYGLRARSLARFLFAGIASSRRSRAHRHVRWVCFGTRFVVGLCLSLMRCLG